MRHDMNKVLQTPPRYDPQRTRPKSGFGKIRSRASRVILEYDEDGELDEVSAAPRSQGMRRPAAEILGWDRKQFSDLLGPLRRYLQSKVGQPWNKVVSEISAQFPRNGNTTQRHIWTHIDGFVIPNCTREKGTGAVFRSDGSELLGSFYYNTFYVDQYGILSISKPFPKGVKPFKAPPRVLIEYAKNLPNSRLVEMPVRLDGVWYRGWFGETSAEGKNLHTLPYGQNWGCLGLKTLTKLLDLFPVSKEDATYFETCHVR